MIGETISHYRVLDRIGAGGMGEVYRAHDPRLNREVALKVLPSSFSREPDRLARFEREARAAGALNHPNILAIYDVGSQDGMPYIVSELLDGETLRDRMASGTLTVRKAVDLAAQVAEGLAAAHGKGIVHRDLKPDNVFITRDGHAKILDFGLAKLTQREAASGDGTAAPTTTMLTEAGTVVGTVSYMSPEQLLGATLDHRSDVFSFGVVLYEMLSRRRPFDGDSRAQIIASILRDEPAPLSDPGHPVPSALDRVVRQCLEKRPEERFESAHDLAFMLRAVSASMSSAPAMTVGRQPKTALRLIPSVVVLAAVAAIAVWWGMTRYATPTLPEQTRIAVLPFEAVGDDPDDALLAAGLTDTVSDGLLLLEQQTDGRIWVARRPAVDTLDQAWMLDNVTLGIEGRLRFEEDRVRFDLALLEAEGGRRLRRAVIDDQISNLSCLQREPIVRIADMLGLAIQPDTESRLESATTIVQAACMLCLRGRGKLSGSTGIEDLEAAVETLDRAVAEDPGYGFARMAIARASRLAYLETRDPMWVERGLEEARRVVDQGGLELMGFLEQGRLLLAAGRLDEAIASFTVATRAADWNADAFFALGFAHEAAAQFEQAEAAYQAGISRRPGDVRGYSWLGFLNWTTSELDAAANQFRRMTEVAPNNPDGYNNYGAVLATMGRREEALEVFQRSLEVDPDNGVAYSQLGTLHFLESRFGSAAEMLERAVALAPDDFDLLVNLAAAYHWGGQRDQAKAVYRRAIEVGEARFDSGDESPVLLARLASCHAMVDGRDRALVLLDEVIARLPPQAQVMGMIAEAYEDLGERERALEWIERAVEHGLSVDWVDERPALSRLKEDPGFRALSERIEGTAIER
jgi:serine/threonine-protein kinase